MGVLPSVAARDLDEGCDSLGSGYNIQLEEVLVES